MKKLIIALLSIVCLTISCTNESVLVQPTHEVKYEVNSGFADWLGGWTDENGTHEPKLNKNGWTITFTPPRLPFQLNCNAVAMCPCGTNLPDVTINLYVDGKLVKTETNNIAQGKTKAVFDLNL
jgi:hypothetical protein